MSLLRRAFRRLDHFFQRPSWFSEWASGITTTLWGGISLALEPLHAPSTQLMQDIWSGPGWSYIILLLGMGQILFPKIDGDWKTPWFRVSTALILSWIWGMATVSTLDQPVRYPLAASAFGWCLVNCYLVVRALWRFK